MRNLILGLLLPVFLVSGCASEIDKCIEAQMKVYDAAAPDSRIKTFNTRLEYEAQMRLVCMNVSSGKR